MTARQVLTPTQFSFSSGTNAVTIPVTVPSDHNAIWVGIGFAIGGGGHVSSVTHAGNACSTQQAETPGNDLGYTTRYREFTAGTGTGNVVVTVTGLVLGEIIVMTWQAANPGTPFPDAGASVFTFSGTTDQTIASATGRRVFQFAIVENIPAGTRATTHSATDETQLFYDPGGGTMWVGLCSLPGAASVTLGYTIPGNNLLGRTFSIEEGTGGGGGGGSTQLGASGAATGGGGALGYSRSYLGGRR
jgi:hypothetical protein